MALLLRKVANLYVPPVNVLEDKAAFEQMFELHVEKKRLLNDLLIGGVDHEEVLEALEAYIGTSNMDNYIEQTEQQLDLILTS